MRSHPVLPCLPSERDMHRDLRRLAAATSAILVAACATPAPTTTTIVAEGGFHITFAGGEYGAFGAQSEPPDGIDDFEMVIPLEDITPIGLATEADPVRFPDRAVFQIRSVDVHDAVVMFDRSSSVPEMLVFTRGGRSPTIVPGLCDYYTDPSLRLCGPRPS
jgi:hypothetical protein